MGLVGIGTGLLMAQRRPPWKQFRPRLEVCSVNISGPYTDVADWSVHDPLRKSVGQNAVMHKHGFFDDVVGCDPRLEGST